MRAAACPTAYINQVMQPITDYTRAVMARGGVTYVIPGLRQAIVALRNVAWWSEATRARGSRPCRRRAGGGRSRCPRRGAAARPVVGGRGPPAAGRGRASRSCLPGSSASADDAAKAAAEFGGPVCVKVVSPQILHKTDIGGVLLDVPAGGGRGA